MSTIQTKSVLESQMNDKEKCKAVDRDRVTLEGKVTQDFITSMGERQFHLRRDVKNQKSMYKDILDQQVKMGQMHLQYGTMTKTEKHLNKEQLNAYKTFDNKEYSLVPGIGSNVQHKFASLHTNH